MIEAISIDIETFSDQKLGECGVYRYAESPDAELLLFGYAINDGEIKIIDVASGELIPEEILAALSDDHVTKWAFNANFERVFLSIWLKRNYPEYFTSYGNPEDSTGNYLNPISWRCSAVWSAYLGLPLSLEGVGAVLNLEDQKLKEGKDLIRYFCSPCSPTKANGGRTRNLPSDSPEKWELFRKYNRRDVEVEMAIHRKLSRFPVPDRIWEEYLIDQEINDRGIALDMDIVNHAIEFDAFSKTALMAAMKELTALDNPNSVTQVKQWLADKGIKTDCLDKKTVQALLDTVPSDVAETPPAAGEIFCKKIQGNGNLRMCRWQGQGHVPVLRCESNRPVGGTSCPAAESATEPSYRPGHSQGYSKRRRLRMDERAV